MGFLNGMQEQQAKKLREQQEAEYAAKMELRDTTSNWDNMMAGLSGMFSREPQPVVPQYYNQAQQVQNGVQQSQRDAWLNSPEGMAAKAASAREYEMERGYR